MQFVAQHLRKLPDITFAGRIDRDSGRRGPGRQRGHIQDIPRTAAFHRRAEIAAKHRYGLYVQADHPFDPAAVRFGQIVEKEYAGVVDQYLHFEPLLPGVFEKRVGGVRERQVAAKPVGPYPELPTEFPRHFGDP